MYRLPCHTHLTVCFQKPHFPKENPLRQRTVTADVSSDIQHTPRFYNVTTLTTFLCSTKSFRTVQELHSDGFGENLATVNVSQQWIHQWEKLEAKKPSEWIMQLRFYWHFRPKKKIKYVVNYCPNAPSVIWHLVGILMSIISDFFCKWQETKHIALQKAN